MEQSKGISSSTLKIIAILTMLADHTAAIILGRILVLNGIYSVQDLSPEYLWEMLTTGGTVGIVYVAYQFLRRVVGRLAFPIFCFLLVEGFQRTRSRAKYALRLFLFALISEPFFDLAFYGSLWEPRHQNVFFTLLLGLMAMMGMEAISVWFAEREKQLWQTACKWLLLAAVAGAAALLAQKLGSDYRARGVVAIVLLYLFRYNRVEQLLAGCVAFAWEVTAPLAFLPVAFYKGKKGLRLKYIFYFFYPVHLLVLYLLQQKIF